MGIKFISDQRRRSAHSVEDCRRSRARRCCGGRRRAPITPGCARPINARRPSPVALELLLHLRANFHKCGYWLVSAPKVPFRARINEMTRFCSLTCFVLSIFRRAHPLLNFVNDPFRYNLLTISVKMRASAVVAIALASAVAPALALPMYVSPSY